ncbi:MAG: GNAT family N-acetyltransferase [Spirochaetes bacterium]|nr:GNAT family N-acetyltransferase [Spirochaetota bacterium]MBU1079505.1 GNAT family N-acetyltransferase [Spirochaetota bacterium]
MSIRDALASDAEAIIRIYNPYVVGTTITFEETPVGADEMRNRIAKNGDEYAWLVYEGDGRVLGYAYASRWRERCAYRSSVESTVYVEEGARGRGIGRALYEALLERLRAKAVHVVIGGIAMPNERSVGLHEALGFERVANFPEVGYKFGRWIDVGYWAKKL